MITVIVAGLIDSWLGVCVGWFAASLMAVASMADDDVAPPKADAVGLPDLAKRATDAKGNDTLPEAIIIRQRENA